MNEESKNNDQHTEEQQPTDETQAELRKVSEVELKQILEDHKKWLESDGKEGKKANLVGANLNKSIFLEANFRWANLHKAILKKSNFIKADFQKANLIEANLQQAELWEANFQRADIRRADLQKANLNNTNLKRADFRRANLKEARLIGANLSDADFSKADMRNISLDYSEGMSDAKLKYANLEGASGLLGNEFAQTDVTGTKLPDDIKEFKALESVEKTSQNARKIFFAMLLGCVYSWLTIATTTDVRLLTNTSSSPLPIIQTEIPIAGFYWAAPLVLMCIYVYFHFYLLKLWTALASLPAIFPDGKRLEERAYPWLLNDLVCRYFKILSDRSLIMHLKEWVTIFLAWWVVPITMIGFWIRYLVRHELIGTSIHIFLLLFSIASSLIFFQLCKTILQGDDLESFSLKNFVKAKRISVFILAGFSFIFVSIVGFTYWGADFREMDISIKPSDYYKIEDVKKQIESVKGANLKGRNLNNADMSSAFLVKANLRESNIQNALLWSADLREAILEKANLQNADLHEAKIQGAKFFKANLKNAFLNNAELQGTKFEGAILIEASLQGSNLQEAILRGAELKNANLSGAYLRKADLLSAVLQEAMLQGADLKGACLANANLKNAILWQANLQGSDLRDVQNLTYNQLKEVQTLYQAKLDPELLEQIKKCCPHLLEKPKEVAYQKDKTE